MRVYDAVLDYLQSAQVTHFAGMVGSTSAPYAVGIGQRSELRYVPVRHEQVAAAMMDAVGRLERKPGCLLTHGAAGALAASLGVVAAALDSVPMLVLSATQERTAMERGYWQTSDVLKPMSGVAKWQTRVERPDAAVRAVRHALRTAVTGRPGVTQVDIPIDVSTDEYDATSGPPLVAADVGTRTVAPSADAVGAAAEIVRRARRLCVLVGGGAASASATESATRLAELLHAPVVNSPTSRGVIAEDHPLSFGPSGILGYEPANNVLSEADVVLAIGSRLSDLQTARGTLVAPQATVVQVDIAPESLAGDLPVDLEIVADAESFMTALLTHMRGVAAEANAIRDQWAASLRERQVKWLDTWLGTRPHAGLVSPTEVVSEFIRQLPRTAILTHGAGDHCFYGSAVPVRYPGTHLVSAKLGAMGCSLGYAMGASLVRPDQTVIACVGDGEFMHQIGDLETLVREELPVVVVVFNNFRLGSQVKRLELYGSPVGVHHGNPDFARLAELFGANGYRVDKPGQFAEALSAALSSHRPGVIDVIVDPDARPPRIAISQEAR